MFCHDEWADGSQELFTLDDSRLTHRVATMAAATLFLPHFMLISSQSYLNLNLHFELLSRLTMRHGTVNYVLYDS